MSDMHITRDDAMPAPAAGNGGNGYASRLGAFNSRVVPLLTHYLAVARRRKWLVLGAVVTALALGMIATLLMTPLYRATTTLEIQRESNNIVRMDGADTKSGVVDMEFYQTQYGLLESQSLAERVATELRLQDNVDFFRMFGTPEADEWFENGRLRAGASSRERRIQRAGAILLAGLSVAPTRLSRLVDLSFTSPDPTFSARVVNAWTEHFIQTTLERRFNATRYARNFLEQRLEQTRASLNASERILVGYAARQGIINLPTGAPAGVSGSTPERPIAADDLAAINQERARATGERIVAQSRAQATGGEVSEALQNPAISGLRQRRAELAAEYARMMVQFEPQYPPAVALQDQLTQIDRAITREETRVRSTLQATYRATVQRENDLTGRVDQLKSGLLDLRRRSIQYNIYQRDVDTNRQLYDALLQRYKEIGTAGGVGVTNIAVVDPAQVPTRPSSPRLLLNLFLALLAGSAVGVALALALEQIDDAVSDPSEIDRMLNLPALGAIPNFRDGDPLAALHDRKSDLSEAYLAVQANLAFSTDHGVPKSISVTSAGPGEGKSTTAYALALSLARTGRKALLIDGDMRSPSVHALAGLENVRGLSNFLSGDDNVESLIQRTGEKGIAVITAGPQPPSAAELLAGDRLELLLQRLGGTFDNIIVDAPPVMGLADAPRISSQTEGVVFVLQANLTRARSARYALGRLTASQARIFGVILSRFEAKRAYYGGGYSYGYGYGQTAET